MLNKKRNSAFTLIELLVVIAIIALLLSILMPALKKVKDQARGVVCKSNLHQWHLSFKTYLSENNDRFAPFSQLNWQDWIDKLYPYFQAEKVFICPSAAKTGKQPGAYDLGGRGYMGTTNSSWHSIFVSETALADADGFARIDGSYGYNYSVADNKVSIPGYPLEELWASDLNVASGETVPLFSDSIWPGIGLNNTAQPRPLKDIFPPGSPRMTLPRHGGKYTQVSFLDGHAEMISMKGVWTLKWYKNYDRTTGNNITWPDWIEEISR